jgi:hypothetical protein
MTPQQIAESLASRKGGQIFSVTYRRNCKVKKGTNHRVEKETKAQAILAEYGNRAAVKQGILTKDRLPPEAPKGTEEIFYLGPAKFYKMTSGKTCLGFPLSGNEPTIEYFVDGQLSPEPDYLLASEKVQLKSKQDLAENNQAQFKLIDCESILDVR